MINNFKFQILNFKTKYLQPKTCLAGRQAYNLKPISGQTMLEILVALSLIILFLSGIAIVELYSIKNLQFSQAKSIATKLASEQLERARVVRDTAGISQLTTDCTLPCFVYINAELTPGPSPTGVYGQSLRITAANASDCPIPDITITPTPIFYKVTSIVNWNQGAQVTPAAEIQISTCITDWR